MESTLHRDTRLDPDRRRFDQNGFTVPEARIPPSTLRRIQDAYNELSNEHPDLNLDFVPSPHVPNYTPGLVDCAPWLEFAAIPQVLDAVEAVIGGDFLMWGSAIFGKPAVNGKETPLHQDGEYWPIQPLASVTVWIAIDDSRADNGCLRVVPGSHLDRNLFKHKRVDSSDLTLNQVIHDPRVKTDSVVDITLEAGEFSIHDIYLVHGSRPNLSDQRRAGLTYRYMPTSSHFNHQLAGELAASKGVTDMSERPLYQMRGVDLCKKNDYSIGAASRLDGVLTKS